MAQTFFFAGYRGHLATITSTEENQFLISSVLPSAGAAADWWLGGYQDPAAPDYSEPSGGWRWVTGEAWSFTYWGGGEPNNAGREDVLHLTRAAGHWNDLYAPYAMPGFVVEYEAPPTPGAARIGILPNPTIAGHSTVGVLSLDRPAALGDTIVTLSSSDPAVAAVPALVIVPAGASTVPFSIVTFAVSELKSVVLTSVGPGGARTATLQVLPVGFPMPPGNLLVNGSFEQPRVPANQDLLTLKELPGWRVTRGSVDLLRAAVVQAAPGEGDQCLDLVGSPGAATIEQSVATEPGRDYLFSGWIAHNPGNPVAPEGRADVAINGQFYVQLFHRDAQATATDMRWQRFAYRFRAAGRTTSIAVADVTHTWETGGLMLDGLSVTPISPNLLVNGSFEEPELTTAVAGRLFGASGLPGWRVAQGNVEVVQRGQWEAAPGQGSQSLDLVGDGVTGVLEQAVPTEPGRTYRLTGWLAHNPVVGEARANLFLGNEFVAPLVHSSALYGTPSPSTMRWQPFVYLFRATGTTTTMTFVDVTGVPGAGVLLDGLVVAPSPEVVTGLAPASPTNLGVRLISPTQVELSWNDNAGDETGYEIERRNGNGEWGRIAVVAANVTRFSDFGVQANTRYSFRVRARNEVGPSGYSNEATVTTLPGP